MDVEPGRMGLLVIGSFRDAVQPTPVVFPPRLIHHVEVVVVSVQTHGTIDEFVDNVCVAGMAVSLGGNVYQNTVQRHLAPVAWPPRHVSDGVQVQRSVKPRV